MSTVARRGAVRSIAVLGLALASILISGCWYFPAAIRAGGGAAPTELPWWCESDAAALSQDQCETFSAQLDVILADAYQYPTRGEAIAGGYLPIMSVDGLGSIVSRAPLPQTFDAVAPVALHYAGTSADSRLVGVSHLVWNPTQPEGYPGDRENWRLFPDSFWPDLWIQPMWIVRGYENQVDVFAADHPCLASGVTLSATTDACFEESHPDPFEVLVTNDDGISAAGIDAMVEALRTQPGFAVTVVAPATNQSGTGDRRTEGGAPGSPATTASGYAGTAVAGTPADSIIYALDVLRLNPDLVVSGINFGANMSIAIPISGTVGAARTAARRGLGAVATSQGIGQSGTATDFPTGAQATLDWIEDFRLGLVGPPFQEVANINTPSCATGTSVRGLVDTVPAEALNGRNYNGQNCASTVTTIADDVDAMNHGFISRTDAKRN